MPAPEQLSCRPVLFVTSISPDTPFSKGKQHKVDRLVERHDKARHVRVGDGDGLAGFNLRYPERNNASARAEHIAIARAADLVLSGEQYGFLPR